MDARKELALRELARRVYRHYVEYVNQGRWLPTKLGCYLCKEVQEFIEADTGHAYDILVLSVSPQHGKSMTVTEALPSWYIGKYPHKRVIELSYNETFAQSFGRANKTKVERFGGNLFGVRLAVKPALDTEFKLDNGVGGMISRGVMSGVTGQPCDLLLIDDPVKNREEADSETYRNKLFDEWQNSFKTRLAAGAKIILIMTRWHEDDLAGRILKTERNVREIRIPCEAEDNDPLGRKVGDALCPEIGKGNDWLAEFKASYQTISGSRAWNALYQGRPTSAEGNLIKREWWRYYLELPEMMQTIISVDAAFKDRNDNDFVAIQCWGKRNADIYLVDAVKAHLNFPETLQAIRDMREAHPKVGMILVEDKANGSAIIQILQREIPGVIGVNPEGGKVARVNAVSGAIESGNVYLPEQAAFTGDFVEECTSFPNGKHDDQVDCMSQALNRLIYFSATVPEAKDPYKFPFTVQKPKAPLGQGGKISVI